ncbi:MAG: hypothetical protein QOG77_3661, partial [Solirubrobacteraceae bacterium]|nr:hypothetical protein [Solirubrobacteraceae bacterium]
MDTVIWVILAVALVALVLAATAVAR